MEGGSPKISISALASALSENAAEMWMHYRTMQTCEPHLRIGQQCIVEPTPNCKQDTVTMADDGRELDKSEVESDRETMEIQEVESREGEVENDRETGEIQEIESREGEVENDRETGEIQEIESREGEVEKVHGETKAVDDNLQSATIVPLASPPSSLPSSCFVTPTSTPSRSPSPYPHPALLTSPDTLKQLSIADRDSVDNGGGRNEGNQMDNFFEFPLTKLNTTIDIETQTQSLSVHDSYTQTESPVMLDVTTNTDIERAPELIDNETQTEGESNEVDRDTSEVGCSTELQISPELQERAQLAEKIAKLQSELAAGILERNEAKSQQMVAEELARIVQSELVELRQRNVAETTTKVRLENQLGELKAELSSAQREVKEKEERITELEETLKGTSLLVRKLEEQTAVSLMNRGGIDYMLQAKLADARAQEAEQKLEVAQTELLQRQGEVKRLLERVGEATRDRSEMVSSKVHNQLLQIADERAHTAEQKALQLERELLHLHEKGGETADAQSTSSRSISTYSSSLGGYPTLSSTLLPPSYISSPYSSTLPSSSSVSLEPFKLDFSIPSSTVSSLTKTSHLGSEPNTERPTIPAFSESSTGTDQRTGLLKPSEVLTKAVKKDRHVIWDDKPDQALPQTTSVDTEPVLPSVMVPPTQFSLPPPPNTDTPETGEQESSSDWSSSEEEDRESDDEGGGAPLRPSTHSALQAQWEWRAMEGSLSDKYPMATGHTPKKNPPPVAPKPRVSWTTSLSTTTTDSTPYQLLEDPSSFTMPAHSSGLTSLTSSFAKPRGPQGRRLPSRFS